MLSVSTPVAVVGSGPSGIAAAFRLHQAGYRVRLFERSDYVGGKLKTARRDGFVIDQGAIMMATNSASFLSVAHDAGLAGEIVPGGDIFGFPREGVTYNLAASRMLWSGLTTKMLSARSKVKLIRLATDLAKLRGKLDYEDLSRAAEIDYGTPVEYARKHFNDEILEYLFDPIVRALVGVSADDISTACLLFSIDKFIGARFFALRDGMESYPLAIAKLFDVELNASVTNVSQGIDDVVVHWRDGANNDHSETFAGCVLAVPAYEVGAVLADLDSWRANFIRSIRYTSMISVGFALSRRPSAISTYINVPNSVAPGLVGVSLEHHRAPNRVPSGAGLVTALTHSEHSQALMDQDDDVVGKAVLEWTEKVVPGIADNVKFNIVSRWHPLVLHSRPGHWHGMREFNRIRKVNDRRVQLAGDYFATSNVNTASAAGERAARELLTHLDVDHDVDHRAP